MDAGIDNRQIRNRSCFKVCRVCMTKNTKDLKSLFEAAEQTEFFQLVTGVDVSLSSWKHSNDNKVSICFQISKDAGHYEAFICNVCEENLLRTSDFRKRANRVEDFYFKPKREGLNDSDVTVIEPEAAPIYEISSDDDENQQPRVIEKPPNKKAFIKAPLRKFKCRVCEKALSSKQTLRYHLQNIHEKVRKYSCDFCQKKFFYKQQIELHVKRHLGLNPETSSTAKKLRKPRNKLKLHKLRLFKCNIDNCSTFYKKKMSLRNHQKVNHAGKYLINSVIKYTFFHIILFFCRLSTIRLLIL